MKKFKIYFDGMSIIIEAKDIREALEEFEEVVLYSEIENVEELCEES